MIPAKQQRGQSLPPRLSDTHCGYTLSFDAGRPDGITRHDDISTPPVIFGSLKGQSHEDLTPTEVPQDDMVNDGSSIGEVSTEHFMELQLLPECDLPSCPPLDVEWNDDGRGRGRHSRAQSIPGLSGQHTSSNQEWYDMAVYNTEQSPVAQQAHQQALPTPQVCELPPNTTTTLMMYNIPFLLTVTQVLKTINDHGFARSYASVQMPPSKGVTGGEKNIGYAFITLNSDEAATEFLEIFQNFSFPNCESAKLTCTQPARFNKAPKGRRVGKLANKRGKH